VSERPDGRYHALWEKRGGLWELGEAAKEAKDRFLIDRIVVDTRDELATAYIRGVDGLCFYGEDKNSNPLTGSPSQPQLDHGSCAKIVATVVAAPERIVANYRSALERTREVIMTGRLLVHEQNCPRLVYTLRQPLEELLKSPVMKALVWVVTALDDAGRNGPVPEGPFEPWYGNLSRGPR